jgi:hypothetical protein
MGGKIGNGPRLRGLIDGIGHTNLKDDQSWCDTLLRSAQDQTTEHTGKMLGTHVDLYSHRDSDILRVTLDSEENNEGKLDNHNQCTRLNDESRGCIYFL